MIGLTLLARAILSAQTAAITVTVPQEKVIVKLVCRNQTVSVLSTPQGVRYSASDLAGKTLFGATTLQNLKTDHPEVYRLVESSVCTSDGVPMIDASVELSADR
jgi:hypothetical protein